MYELLDEKVFIKNELNSAKMRLSAPEIDLLILLATKVREGDYQQITVSYQELVTLYGESKVYYKHLSPIFDGLMRNIIEVFDVTKKEYVKCCLVSKVVFNKNAGFAVFYIDVFVANLLRYVKSESTIFQLRTVLELRSVHAKRIYMMASQFKKSGKWNVELADLKNRLGLIDQKKGTELYKRFADFRVRVLDQAIKEINEKAEFKIHIEPGKRGQEITRLQTIIYTKSTKDELSLTDKMKHQVQRMRAAGLSEFQIENILFECSEDRINKTLYNFDLNKSKIKNPGGWLSAAFEAQGVEMRRKLVDIKQLDLVNEINKNTSAA